MLPDRWNKTLPSKYKVRPKIKKFQIKKKIKIQIHLKEEKRVEEIRKKKKKCIK